MAIEGMDWNPLAAPSHGVRCLLSPLAGSAFHRLIPGVAGSGSSESRMAFLSVPASALFILEGPVQVERITKQCSES